MKRFRCHCSQRAFFQNSHCLACGRLLGFDPLRLELVTLEPEEHGQYRALASGGRFRLCANRGDYEVCNWLVAADDAASLCRACRLNEVIPSLARERNLLLWRRLEGAKRRLIYDLLKLKLPLVSPASGAALTFRFLEDQRTNPAVSESFVTTGHMGGTITINVGEADDVLRHTIREDMQERYRTLLGHFRHESGHFYFHDLVESDAETLAGFRRLFGDERSDYAHALESYYHAKPDAAHWSRRFVSQYAAAHPWEDWAESWAHYLHVVDTLETAVACDMIASPDWSLDSRDWIYRFMELAVTLNELTRSMGGDDAYPFVLTEPVADKLCFIHRRVVPAQGSLAASAAR